MSKIIRVVHRTEYVYSQPVKLEQHRLMLRPRDGHDLWVDDAHLKTLPPARIDWCFDAFGNSVAHADFSEPTDRLVIESELVLRRYVWDYSKQNVVVHSSPFPCIYSDDDAINLQPYLRLQEASEENEIREWLDRVLPEIPSTAFGYLQVLSDTINRELTYSRREEMGTQTAAQTIRSGTGTCRDFALLFMDAARVSGFAARFVTGYLHSPGTDAVRGTGATHAWSDAFIPDVGWIEFDPTNRIIGGRSLIRVGATRTPAQASPISGSYEGPPSAFESMSVSVEISEFTGGSDNP